MVISFIKNTPWWAWIVLSYILFIGIRDLHQRIIPLWKLFIIPCLCTLWFIFNFSTLPTMSIPAYQWIGAISIGILFGYIIGLNRTVRVGTKPWTIQIGGTSVVLLLFITLFLVKYYFGYKCTAAHSLETYMLYRAYNLLFTSGTHALFWTQSIVIAYKYWKNRSA